MLKLLTFSLIFVIFIAGFESVVLECKYEMELFGGYACIVMNPEPITSKCNREISQVQDQHLSGKSDNDVNVFWSLANKMNYFPRGLTKFFKNIQNVVIYHANLKEISKKDLEQFGNKIRYLYLAYNDIEIIEGDLFEFSWNLLGINFSYNKLKHIDPEVFDGLNVIHTLDLESNPCLSDSENMYSIYIDHTAALQYIKRLKGECKDPDYEHAKTSKTQTTSNQSTTISPACLTEASGSISQEV